jgi:hypothetical protein
LSEDDAMKRCLAAIPLLVSLACGNGRAPESPAAGDALADDGGAPSCDDLARAQTLCAGAMMERCRSQSNDCETVCEARGGLPANTEKLPSRRNEFEATRCRDNCRIGLDACARHLLGFCPRPCE